MEELNANELHYCLSFELYDDVYKFNCNFPSRACVYRSGFQDQ